MTSLNPGDVLSFSSGSHDRGPYGFRTLRRGGNLLAVITRMFPELAVGFEGRLPFVVNAYPASIGTFDFAVSVDTYLSLSTGSRSLHLAALEGMPVMLLGQPLYIADLILRHLKKTPMMPDTLLIGTGGYVMPRSLERALREFLADKCKSVSFVHGYGVAEVDAACLLAAHRNEKGELIYCKRGPQVGVDFQGTDLLLSLKDEAGKAVIDRFPTGDSGRPEGDGYAIWNNERLHPNVLKILESWSTADWTRRTGYLYYGREVRFQLRKGEESRGAIDCEYYDYEKRYGQSWLFKPMWGRQADADRDSPLRRTIM